MTVLRDSLRVCVVGTSNSLLSNGYTDALRLDPRVVAFKNCSIGKSISLLQAVTTDGVQFKDFDVCILDFAVNEHVFFAWGLTAERITKYLRGLIGRVWNAGCLPVLLILPRRSARSTGSYIRTIYLSLADELNLPYFDVIKYVEHLESAHGVPRESMFLDDGHLKAKFAFELGRVFLSALLQLPLVTTEKYNWTYFRYRAQSLSTVVDSEIPRSIRKNSMFEMSFLKLGPGVTAVVEVRDDDTVVGLYTNLAQCAGHVRISGQSSAVVDLRNDYYSGKSDFVLSALAIRQEVLPMGGQLRIEVLSQVDIDVEEPASVHHMLREGIRLPDNQTAEVGGLIIESSTIVQSETRPHRSCYVSLAEISEPESLTARPNKESKMESRLDIYYRTGYVEVEGWVAREIIWLLPILADFHKRNDVVGGYCEIGVHHGRLFFALANTCEPADHGVAIDIFEDQHLNVDRSGRGNRQIFEAGIKKYCPTADNILIHKIDSTDPAALSTLRSGNQMFRFFSIDGGHTLQHVVADLALADASLVNGGFILVDDYCNPGFPGVTEGLIGYLQRGSRMLPVCAAGGKIILTSLSYVQAARDHVRAAVTGSGRYRFRDTTICGFPYINFAAKA